MEKVDKVLPLSLSETETPWLLYTHGNSKHKQVQTFCSISPDNKSYIKSIPQLRGKRVLASSCGCLILRDRSQRNLFSVYNLVTSQVINLSPLLQETLYYDDGKVYSALTSSPDCHDCVLLLFFNDPCLMFSCYPAQPNSGWASQTLYRSVRQLVTLNGVIYCETFNSELLFCVKDDHLEPVTLIPLKPDMSFHYPGYLQFLLASCGHVYKVFLYVGDDIALPFKAIKIFELDLQHKIWVEVKCLGGRSFFLGSSSCTWCWGNPNVLEPSGGIQENSIYVLLNEGSPGEPETVYVHDLLDQTWTVVSPCPGFISPHDFPVWVIPQQLRLLAKGEWKESILSREWKESIKVDTSINQELPPDNQTQENLFTKLPFHLVESIPMYMHLFEYWNFRVSCKLFHSAFPASEWRANKHYPLLMFFKNNGGLCTIMDPYRLDSRSCSNILPTLDDSCTLFFSKNGWLLYTVDESISLQFVNLFTRERGIYPSFQYRNMGDMLVSLAFSTSPTCPKCLTVGIFDYIEDLTFNYLEPGSKAWTMSTFDHEDIMFQPSKSSPLFLGGAFYFLDKSGYLGEFELMDGQPRWQVHDKPPIDGNKLYMSCLVDCGGGLYSVFIDKIQNHVQVFRFNDLEKNWIKNYDLGNHSLFISCASSFSLETRDPKLRNNIYLPKLRDNSIVFYSQDTRKFHIKDDDGMETLSFAKEHRWGCWV